MSLKKIFCLCVSLFMLASCAHAGDFNYSKYRTEAILRDNFSGYMSEVQDRIKKNWTPPDFVEEGSATVLFRVNRDGNITSMEIVSSSNNEIFDESALEALRKSAPFDAFPANSIREFITVKYNFHSTIVKTEKMKEYVENSDKFFNVNNDVALDYINLAINEAPSDIRSYFLYGKRSKIKRAIGDIEGAKLDLEKAKLLKAKFDKKQINSGKLLAEMENTPFAYFLLASTYESVGDYVNAIEAINKSIEMTQLNNQYKRYRSELIRKSSMQPTS